MSDKQPLDLSGLNPAPQQGQNPSNPSVNQQQQPLDALSQISGNSPQESSSYQQSEQAPEQIFHPPQPHQQAPQSNGYPQQAASPNGYHNQTPPNGFPQGDYQQGGYQQGGYQQGGYQQGGYQQGGYQEGGYQQGGYQQGGYQQGGYQQGGYQQGGYQQGGYQQGGYPQDGYQQGGYQQGGYQQDGYQQGGYQQGGYQQGGYGGYDLNVYTPEGHLHADRGKRLAAALIDGFLLGLCLIPGFIFFGISANTRSYSDRETFFALGVLMMLLFALGFQIYQWVLISKYGQSVAKKWMKLKIIKINGGGPPGFVHGVLLRGWVFGIITNIPVIGALVGLANPFFIFGQERRCIHDMIAQTRVINAEGENTSHINTQIWS